MYKVDLEHENFDGETVTSTLYFNITKTRLAKNLELRDELDEIQKMIGGETRELTPGEIQKIVNLVEKIMKISYGVRSEDGKRFDQRADRWEEFQQTAAYDAFLYSLFETPSKATEFMVGVMPKDLIRQAEAQIKQVEEANPSKELTTAELLAKIEELEGKNK